jgi:YD repeat-containing protein
MGLPAGTYSSGGHVVDSDGLPVVRIIGASGGPAAVASGSVVQTAMTYTNGLLTSYVENGLTWTIARDADGNPTSITHT